MWFKKVISSLLALQLMILPALAQETNSSLSSNLLVNSFEQQQVAFESQVQTLKTQGWDFLDLDLKPFSPEALLTQGKKSYYLAPQSEKYATAIQKILIKVTSSVNEQGAEVFLSAYPKAALLQARSTGNTLPASIASTKVSISVEKSALENQASMDQSVRTFSRNLAKKLSANASSSLLSRVLDLLLPSAHAYNHLQDTLGWIASFSIAIGMLSGFTLFMTKRFNLPTINKRLRWTLIGAGAAFVLAGTIFAIVTWIQGPYEKDEK